MSLLSDFSYPNTDKNSIDSSDDENFRQNLNLHHEETNTPIKCREASFANNFCIANTTKPPDQISFSRDVANISLQSSRKKDLQYYQRAIVPLLKELGYDFDPIQIKLMIPEGSSITKIGPDVLQRIAQIFEGNAARDTANNDSSEREFLISHLEEEILFKKIKATIVLQTAVEASRDLSNLPPATGVTQNNINIKRDEVTQSSSLTNLRKRDRATYEQKQMKTSPPDNGSIFNFSNKYVEFVDCHKVLPKFTSNSPEGEEIFPPTFATEAVKKVFEDLSKAPSPSQRKRLLHARLSNDATDPLSLIIHAKGRSDLVDNLLKLVGKRVTSIQALENVNAVLGDKQSLVVNVKVDVTDDIGLKAVKPFGNNRERAGIWIASTYSGGQFQDIFGNSTDQGAVMMKVSGKNVYKLADKNRLLAKAKSEYEESGKMVDKWTIVTVCLSRYANLEHLDYTRVILSKEKSIRYRDGTAYEAQKRNNSLVEQTSTAPSNKIVTAKNGKLGSSSRIIASHEHLSEPDTKIKSEIVKQNSEPSLLSPDLQDEVDDNISVRQKRVMATFDNKNGMEDYTIIFNPSIENPGFYCETRKLANGKGTYCAITSLDPEGTAVKKGPLIRTGTVIAAFEVMDSLDPKLQKLTIYSHTDLKLKYEAVKTKHVVTTQCKLYFHNRGSKTLSLDQPSEMEWTKKGAWIGEEKDGWAGGATIAKNEDNKILTKLSNSVPHGVVSVNTVIGKSLSKEIEMTANPAQTKNETAKLSQPKTPSKVSIEDMRVSKHPRSSKLILQQGENSYDGSIDKGAKSTTSKNTKGQDDSKPHKNTNTSVNVMKSDTYGERQRRFLQAAGTSISKSLKEVSSSFHNSSSKSESTAAGVTNETLPHVEHNSVTKQILPSILRKAGEKKALRRVSFDLSVIVSMNESPQMENSFYQKKTRGSSNGFNSNFHHCNKTGTSSVINTNNAPVSETSPLGSRQFQTNGGNVIDHKQVYKLPPSPLRRNDIQSGNPPSPPQIFNSNDPVDDIVNIVLYSTPQDLKLFLEKYQPSGSQIAPALSAVKRSNGDGSDSELKKKAIVLKIYSNIFYLLGKARDLKDRAVPNTPEYREERKMILKELHEKAAWIQQFQARERAKNNHTIIDGNIKMPGGFTMLHAAVILSDIVVTEKIMSIGAYPMATCNRWGSVFDLSKSIQHESSYNNDRRTEAIQTKLYTKLSSYQKAIFSGHCVHDDVT